MKMGFAVIDQDFGYFGKIRCLPSSLKGLVGAWLIRTTPNNLQFTNAFGFCYVGNIKHFSMISYFIQDIAACFSRKNKRLVLHISTGKY